MAQNNELYCEEQRSTYQKEGKTTKDNMLLFINVRFRINYLYLLV